jgi:hypothetical protein
MFLKDVLYFVSSKNDPVVEQRGSESTSSYSKCLVFYEVYICFCNTVLCHCQVVVCFVKDA